MYSIGMIFLTFMLVGSPLNADLKYQQEVILSSFQSKEDSIEMANKFLQAAKDDLDLKVIGIRYKQEKCGEGWIAYNAIITCYVSQIDQDILRIQGKMIQNSNSK
jgi:hypothetical protein